VHLNLIPTIYAATKADLDRQEQRCEVQPDTYTRVLGLQPPIHVSALWGATGDLFVQLAEAAGWPGTAVPRYLRPRIILTCRSEDDEDWLWGGTNTRFLLAAATFGGLVLSLGGSLVWRAARSRWNTVH
jgi:mitochondrial Rho GTPase 1